LCRFFSESLTRLPEAGLSACTSDHSARNGPALAVPFMESGWRGREADRRAGTDAVLIVKFKTTHYRRLGSGWF
jgi:hypothetical protein